MGWDHLRRPTNAITFIVEYPSWDESGNPIQRRRMVYGVAPLMRPYPDHTQAEEADLGGAVRVTITLSEYVWPGEIATVIIPAGFYSDGAVQNLPAVLGCGTSNLQIEPPAVIGNWTMPGWQVITGNVYRPRAVGFHAVQPIPYDAADEPPLPVPMQPLACVRFIVTDGAGARRTNIVTRMTAPDGIGEYVGEIDLTGLSNPLRTDFEMFPWVGQPLTTYDNDHKRSALPPKAQTNVWVSAGQAYSPWIAVVSPTGNDATGWATNTQPEFVQTPHYFRTLAAAARALAASNAATLGRNDLGGSVIYVRAGEPDEILWTGGSAPSVNRPYACLTITSYPGEVASIGSASGSLALGQAFAFRNIRIEGSNALFNATDHIQFWDCVISNRSTLALAQHITNAWAIRTVCDAGPSGGTWKQFATQVTGWHLRACTSTVPLTISAPLIVGGRFVASGISLPTTGADGPCPAEGSICYGARWLQWTNDSPMASFAMGRTLTNGMAIIQNIFEFCRQAAAQNAMQVSGGSDGYYNTNIIIWHSLLTGQRILYRYNDAGSAPLWKYIDGVIGNLWDCEVGLKSDRFPPGDGGRVGNWPVMYNVGWHGNWFAETDPQGGGGSFPPYALGQRSFYEVLGADAYGLRFALKRSAAVWVSGFSQGFGDYRLLSGSPARRMIVDRWPLPYDIDGRVRGATDPPGPIATGGRARRGLF